MKETRNEAVGFSKLITFSLLLSLPLLGITGKGRNQSGRTLFLPEKGRREEAKMSRFDGGETERKKRRISFLSAQIGTYSRRN